METIRTYSDLERLETFDERFEYLKLGGGLGISTFGYDRYLNQKFYSSREWKLARSFVLNRDSGCDLGIEGYEIHVDPLIHHMNPITVEDIIQHEESIIDPEFLITTTHKTHNAIHYGTDHKYPKVATVRHQGDTNLW